MFDDLQGICDLVQDIQVGYFGEDAGNGLVESKSALVNALEQSNACDELGGTSDLEYGVLT